MAEHGRDAHAKADGIKARRRIKLGFFLIEDDLLHRGSALTADRFGPSDADKTGLIFAGLPALGGGHRFCPAGIIFLLDGVLIGVEPGFDLGAVGGFFCGVFEIHVVSP